MGKGGRVPPLSRRTPKAADGPTALAESLPEGGHAGTDPAPEQRGEQAGSFEPPESLPQRVRGASDGPQPPARVARPLLSASLLDRVRAAMQAEAEQSALSEPPAGGPSAEASATEAPAAARKRTSLPQRVRGAADGPRPPARVARKVLPESFLERVRASAQAQVEAEAESDAGPRARDYSWGSAFTPGPRRAPEDVDGPQPPAGMSLAEIVPPVATPETASPEDPITEPIPVISVAASSATLNPAADEIAAPPQNAAPAPAEPRSTPSKVPATLRAAPSSKSPAAPRATRVGPGAGKRLKRQARASRSYRMAGLLLVTVIIGALALGFVVSHHSGGRGARQSSAAGRRGAGSTGHAPVTPAATRNVAAAWVAAQVTSAALMSCDPVMCRALKSYGIPAGQMLVLKPGMTNPLRSDVIVATPVLQSQIGANLSSIYAPGLLARFGSGDQQIDVRAIAPHGPIDYMSQVKADLAARKMSGTELARSSRIFASAAARRELAAGGVDSRLMTVITGLAASSPVHIVAFGQSGPSPAVAPFRSAELAQTNMQAMKTIVRGQRSPFRAMHMASVRLRTGQFVLRIDFAAPTPFGLLGSSPISGG